MTREVENRLKTGEAKKPKPRKRLASKSAKRIEEDKRRAALKLSLLVAAGLVRMPLGFASDEYLLRRGCAGNVLVPEVECRSRFIARPTLEMHEVVKRSRWRKGVTVRSNCVLLCQAHHDWTESHVTEATKRGLLSSAPRVDPFDKFDAYHPEGER